MPLLLYAKQKLQTLNLFEDSEKTNEEDIKNQRISTYIYLILLILSVGGLMLYASLTPLTKTGFAQNPTRLLFRELQKQYPDTLVCPCSNIIIEFRAFILSFYPIFDQICSSDFISEDWLKHINYRPFNDKKYQHDKDFRHSGYSFFQILKYLCELVSQTIDEQLIEFYSNTLLSENVISEDIFDATNLANKNQFINITRNTLLISLNTTRAVTQGNGIVNRLNTNYYYKQYFYTDGVNIISQPEMLVYLAYAENTYPLCYCSAYSNCKATTGIYRAYRRVFSWKLPIVRSSRISVAYIDGNLQLTVPGVNVGCFMLDTVLLSDLSCMYSEQCLSKLEMYLREDTPYHFTATPLNYSTTSTMHLTIGELIENLFVNKWRFNSSYDSYFKQCNPDHCTYTYIQQFDIIHIITVTIGFIGGIAAILNFITLPVVTFVRQRIVARQSTSDQDPEKETEHDLRNQLIATRIYVCSLTLALIILSSYTLLTDVTKTMIVNNPTFDIYAKVEKNNPICPCKRVSIEYQKIITFEPTFHPICSSDFLTQNWANYLSEGNILFTKDFREVSRQFFVSLSAFCQLSWRTIENQLISFNSTKYVTKNLQSSYLFESETQQIIDLFIRTANSSFLTFFSILRDTMIGDQLFTLENYILKRINEINHDLVTYPKLLYDNNSTSCSCKLKPSICHTDVGIFDLKSKKLLFNVPGLRRGCFPIELILQSTMECFFDQSCLNTIYSHIGSTSEFPFNATAIIHMNTSRYYTTTKIQDIVQQLMIEEWNNQTSFESYFNECMPEKCIYTYNKRADVTYMISTIIGIYGGLITVFQIIIPRCVGFLRRKRRVLSQDSELETESHQVQSNSFIQKYLQIMNNYIKTFNLFKNANRRSEEHLKQQLLSTRLFLIFSLISIIVLLFYSSFNNVTNSVTIKNPTSEQIDFYFDKYSNALRCPCKNSSITYSDFSSIQPESHSICKSLFIIADDWLNIDYPPRSSNDSIYRVEIDDFRYIASPLFQALASFCQLTKQTIEIELLTFNSTTYISRNLITKEEFQSQTNQFIKSFKENTAKSFISSLHLINKMIHLNQLSSGLLTDSIFTVYPQYYTGEHKYIYNRKDRVYRTPDGFECNCQQSSTCIQQAIIYSLDRKASLFSIPGIYVGCYVVEALLQSDLRCFFNIDCLINLTHSLQLFSSDVHRNPSLYLLNSSRYQPKTSVQEIVSNLMIEEWNNQTFYNNYFDKCQPKECIVTYVNRGNIIYIITTIISLIGGLTEVYKFLIPIMVRFMLNIIWPFVKRKLNRNRIASEAAIVTTNTLELPVLL